MQRTSSSPKSSTTHEHPSPKHLVLTLRRKVDDFLMDPIISENMKRVFIEVRERTEASLEKNYAGMQAIIINAIDPEITAQYLMLKIMSHHLKELLAEIETDMNGNDKKMADDFMRDMEKHSLAV